MPKVVAEIGCNHKGDFAIALEMIETAATFCKADIVKFQKRYIPELLTREQYAAPHPEPMHAYGDSYGAHREALEFTADQHGELQRHCHHFKVEYSTSVWDLTSAKQIGAIGPKLLKVPSASNTNFELLRYLRDAFGGQVHISLGMTTRAEEDEIVDLFRRNRRTKDLVLYACTSAYPVAFEDVCLFEVPRLREKFGSDVAAIGFSGHHLGIAADIGALALGAEYFERHFTLDRTWKGTDHSASLEPDGLRRLCRDIRAVSLSLRPKEDEVLEAEVPQRKKLKDGRGES